MYLSTMFEERARAHVCVCVCVVFLGAVKGEHAFVQRMRENEFVCASNTRTHTRTEKNECVCVCVWKKESKLLL